MSVQYQSVWVEYSTPEGKNYFFNTLTKQTSWDKPEELMNPRERILASCQWREFKMDNGQTYFFNNVTNESVWTKPAELEAAERQASQFSSSKDENAIFTPPPPPPASQTNGKFPTEKEESENSDSESDSDNLEDSDVQYKTTEEKSNALRQLLKDKNVSSNSSWENAVKLIASDPRFSRLKDFRQKKQIFNIYKTQKQKEEKEEQRNRIKEAKEELEKLLLTTKSLNSNIRYRAADELFSSGAISDSKIESLWKIIPDRDRRDIYDDAMKVLAAKEHEAARILRKRNIRIFNGILKSLNEINYKTTWSETQGYLLKHPGFAEDEDLQCMDKEDALVCFEKHILELEAKREEDREKENMLEKRKQRKNREAFNVLLEELREKNRLNSLTSWKIIFHIIKRDERFHEMLGQSGSTPLDLFKFFISDLREKLPAEKQTIKDILKERNFEFDSNIDFENFVIVVQNDERGKFLDLGNIHLTYNSLRERAENKDKERYKEEMRRLRRTEQDFFQMLESASPSINSETSWEEICSRFSETEQFQAISLESERMRIFKEYLLHLVNMRFNSSHSNAVDENNFSSSSKRHRSDKSFTGSHSMDQVKLKKSNLEHQLHAVDIAHKEKEKKNLKKSKKSKKNKVKKSKTTDSDGLCSANKSHHKHHKKKV